MCIRANEEGRMKVDVLTILSDEDAHESKCRVVGGCTEGKERTALSVPPCAHAINKQQKHKQITNKKTVMKKLKGMECVCV
jgi:hypothetical protein